MQAIPPVSSRIIGFLVASIFTVSSQARCSDLAPDVPTLALEFFGGGGLGETVISSLSGPANDGYFIWMSLNEGPTQLPAGWIPSSIDVGVDLVGLCASIPGFYGDLGAGGSVRLSLTVPADPSLDGIVLYFVALDLGIAGPPSVGASNNVRLTLQDPETFAAPVGGGMAHARSGAAATLLEDGRVLVTGGSLHDIFDPAGQRSAELYTPSLESFSEVGQMLVARTWHSATRLLDGRVLIAGGGTDAYGNATETAEIYDPATRSFTITGSMAARRAFHTATLLADGRVLIAGGADSVAGTAILTRGLASTEIFDPATGTFQPGPDMSRPRVDHTAVPLTSGAVLISGGITWDLVLGARVPSITGTAQLYDAAAGTMSSDLPMISEAFGHAALRLADGRVAHFGGAAGNVLLPSALDLVQIYDPSTQSFSDAGSLLSSRCLHTATLLDDGRVLIAGGAIGGLTDPQPMADAELWEMATGARPVDDLAEARVLHTAVPLADGTVVVIGGATGNSGATILASAEIFQR